VRRSFSFAPGEKSFVNRIYRAGIDRCLARRHTLTDHFFSLAHHLTGARLRRIVDLARTANVELMVHPAIPDEYSFLSSEIYVEIVRSVELDS
jgi:hypothetical protein